MKSQPSIFTLFAFTCILLLPSCSTLLTGLYGMKKIETVDEKTILQYSEKYNIPIADSYELDSSFISFLTSLDTTRYKEQVKNHSQPLQALYYKRTGQLQSFQVNCYAGSFPNLHWDRDGIMTTFPPGQQAPLDSIVSLEKQLKYLKPLSQTEDLSIESWDYIVIVYWSKFMGRQSERLIRFVQDNSKLAGDKKVKIIYVNNDNIFASES